LEPNQKKIINLVNLSITLCKWTYL
jgi:hypothetical protein